jgi:CheY-like chemotaxis protein
VFSESLIAISALTCYFYIDSNSDEIENMIITNSTNSIINNDPNSMYVRCRYDKWNDRRKNMKVLVVDDDPDITSLYKDALEGEGGFNVDTYNDPSQALSEFKPHYYDISLIDVRMPGMDGFDLYKELKKLDPIIKVCFITGFEVNYRALQEIFPEIAQECYISKPTTMKELKEHVDHLLQE